MTPALLLGTTRPSQVPPVSQFKRFDVRNVIRRGCKPFPEIRQRAVKLKPGEGLLVVAPFSPSPLLESLGTEA